MQDDNDDLLEPYDNDEISDDDYFQESKENVSNLAYAFMMIAFLVVIGIKFFQSLSDTTTDENAMVIRQVQLLKLIETSTNEQEVAHAIAEYDSLANVLETLAN